MTPVHQNMFQGQKASLVAEQLFMTWQPTASIAAIKTRANSLKQIRDFFAERQVLEVETPIIGESTVTDPYIESIAIQGGGYLQTSPEYFMKRLLVAGVGDCYQICKAFRLEERGVRHSPEFSLLEWYRVGFDLRQLMQEVADLIARILGYKQVEYKSYSEVFQYYLQIDPFTITLAALKELAQKHIDVKSFDGSKDDWLNLLMSHCIEPHLGQSLPVFIYDYPPSQAALAKLTYDKSGQSVAARFELYINGLEMANGFDELVDADMQLLRFQADNKERERMGLKPVPIDNAFIAALSVGLPSCSGVALGLDRLLMAKQQINAIDQVISFCPHSA